MDLEARDDKKDTLQIKKTTNDTIKFQCDENQKIDKNHHIESIQSNIKILLWQNLDSNKDSIMIDNSAMIAQV